MSLTLEDIAWHREVGQLIESLDQPSFWLALTRVLDDYVPVDSWVALLFSNSCPYVFAESSFEGKGEDPLFRDYIKGLYLLDPFYIADRERHSSGLFRLSDIAPEHFKKTEYYRLYFTHYVEQDEVQYNVKLDSVQTLCLSLGNKQRFTPEQIALLDLIRPWVTGLMRQRMFFEGVVAKHTSQQTSRWRGSLEEELERMGTPLTPRELDVTRLLLSGCSNKEIAKKLGISAETVKVHRRNIYSKLEINSQPELFAIFLQAQSTR